MLPLRVEIGPLGVGLLGFSVWGRGLLGFRVLEFAGFRDRTWLGQGLEFWGWSGFMTLWCCLFFVFRGIVSFVRMSISLRVHALK